MNSDLVAIAKITKPRGLRGEVVAEMLTDFPDRFDDLERVFGVRGDERVIELTLERHWFQKGRVILKFSGFDSIESVEDFRHLEICIPESETVDLEPGTYYDWQLQGCEVIEENGESLGTVKEIQRTGGNENLVVQGAEKDYLIPFVEAICTEVDIECRLIKIDPPDGLLDF
jgi:16S rRNA processing protein RimM